MAEVDTTQLSQEHGAIRHDIAVESARLGTQIGGEACAINKHIGDARYETARENGDIRRETQQGFAETRYDVATRAGDIRREGAEHTSEIRRDVAKAECDITDAVKDSRYDVISSLATATADLSKQVDAIDDTLTDKLFTVSRDTMDLRAQVTSLGVQVRDNAQMSALQTEKAVLQNTIEGQKNTQYLSDKIVLDGEKTRALINDLKYHDLNRSLVERQTELVNCEQDRRQLHRHWDDARWSQNQAQFGAQFAQLQSMMQNFNSQLSEARQGMVNFGTMAGVGQTSTNNNVR